MPDFMIASGNSSVELNRTSKGEYTWSMKLYFVGNGLREIRQILKRIIAARIQLEVDLGQRIEPTQEMEEYQGDLQDAVKEAAKAAPKKRADRK